jgi:hypothetical protein
MNTMTQQLNMADSLQQLWEGLMPAVEVPERSEFITWASMADEKILHFTVNRVARKYFKCLKENKPMTANDVQRYMTSVIFNEIHGNRKFDKQ